MAPKTRCMGVRDREIGEFKKITPSGKFKGCFEVEYEDGAVQHWPREPNSEYGPTKKWVLMTPIDTDSDDEAN